MSRFAPVCPLPVAEALWDMQLLGDYHLLLAHDVLEPDNRARYRRLYSDLLRAKSNDRVVIMDNSVVELGQAMPFAQVNLAAQIVGADYIVAQDSFLDMNATIAAATTFYQDADAAMDGPPLMGVVQGRTIRECLNVADFYSYIGLFEAIAVPRCLTPVLGSRIPLLLELYKRYSLRFNCWHLLGFSDDNFDDLAAARLPFVSGIDSAAPIRGALQGRRMTLPHCDFGPRGDFWQASRLQADNAEGLLRFNTQMVRSLIAINPQ